MTDDRALSYSATLVLQALSSECEYGLEVIRLTDLSSGTVYPVLRRLEARGLVEARWEDEEKARREGRPARKYYRLTPGGERALRRARERLVALQRQIGLKPASSG